MNMMLAEGIGPAQWILFGVIILLVICYPIFIVLKNKKEQQKAQELTNSLKVGKDVLTSSGVYGTIVAIEEKENGKIVTLQTGTEQYKSYISVDILAIYAVLNPDPIQPENTEVKQEVSEEVKEEVKQEVKEEQPEIKEEIVEEVKQEQQAEKPEKKSKSNKKSKK